MELNDYLNLPYTITLRRDDEGDWIARVQELSGCTAHGGTEAEALERLSEAKREWLAAALEDHVSVPLPDESDELPSGKWVQRVPRSLHNNLRQLAKTEGTSLNHLVTQILSEYVGTARMVSRVTTTTNQLVFMSMPITFQGATGISGWAMIPGNPLLNWYESSALRRAVSGPGAQTGDTYIEKKAG